MIAMASTTRSGDTAEVGSRISLSSALFSRSGYSSNATASIAQNSCISRNGSGMGTHPVPMQGPTLGNAPQWRPERGANVRGTPSHPLGAGPGSQMAGSGTPWRADTAASSSNHVIWGAIEHESQDSLAGGSLYGSCGGLETAAYHSGTLSGARKKIQNKNITRDGITFLDSMSSGGISEEGVETPHIQYGSKKKIQNKRIITTEGHTVFLDSSCMSSGGVSEEGASTHELRPQLHQQNQQCYVYSAEAFQSPEGGQNLPNAKDRHPTGTPCNPEGYSSGEETDDSQEERQRQEQLMRQQAWEHENVDIEALLAQVPLDDDGQPTSIGSIGHANGECKVPCTFVQRARGCVNGINCSFCHFHHKVKRARQRHKGRPRPCKGKRDKYRKHWEELKNRVEENPTEFDPEAVELPASISTYEKLRAKLVTRLKTHKSNVLAGRSEDQDINAQMPVVGS